MSLIELIFLLVIIGVGLYYGQRIPMNQGIRTLITIIVVIACVAMVLDFFGLWDLGANFHHRHRYSMAGTLKLLMRLS